MKNIIYNNICFLSIIYAIISLYLNIFKIHVKKNKK